jgi:zinc transport system substrate-binding protein
MAKRLTVVCLLLAAACASTDDGSDASTPSADEGPLSVYVVNYPLQYFAERIGGELVEVHFPAPPDVDPALWSPAAEAIAAYQRSDLILLNGATYAKWTERVTLPMSKVVDTSASFQDRYIVVENAVVHSHGPEGEHSHGATAFTTWLDPTLAIEQAKAVRDALIGARPQNRPAFEAGFDALETDLRALDERIEKAVGGSDKPLVGSHPVYQYLERRYGLNLETVHFEPDVAPDRDGFQGLERLLEDHPAKWILWEDTPLQETEQKLRDLGLASVVYAPCGNHPTSGDFLSVMEENVAALERVFSSG